MSVKYVPNPYKICKSVAGSETFQIRASLE